MSNLTWVAEDTTEVIPDFTEEQSALLQEFDDNAARLGVLVPDEHKRVNKNDFLDENHEYDQFDYTIKSITYDYQKALAKCLDLGMTIAQIAVAFELSIEEVSDRLKYFGGK